MGQAYVITSGKNGVGKTITIFNLGVCLSMLGKKVVLIDADTCLPSLDKVAGLEDEAKAIRQIMEMNGLEHNLEYLLKYSYLPEYIIIKHKEYRNLSLIPANIIGSWVENRRRLMEELVFCLKEKFDYILIDSPSVIGEDFMNAASAADKAVVVAVPDKSSSEEVDVLISKLEDYGFMNLMLIINRADEWMAEKVDAPGCFDMPGIELLGVVPEDKEAAELSNKGITAIMKPGSKAQKAYGKIARHMAGGYLDLFNEKPHAGVYGKSIKAKSATG